MAVHGIRVARVTRRRVASLPGCAARRGGPGITSLSPGPLIATELRFRASSRARLRGLTSWENGRREARRATAVEFVKIYLLVVGSLLNCLPRVRKKGSIFDYLLFFPKGKVDCA